MNWTVDAMKIVYLIQGKKVEMSRMHKYMQGRDALMLTWDEQVDGCFFYPNSTWSEGRRYLLGKVLEMDYDYVAFLDGDVQVLKGSIDAFEAKIAKYKPAVAIPLFDKTADAYRNIRRYFKHGLIYDSDEQFQIFSAAILRKIFLNNPYVSRFDSVSWWYPCVVVQGVIGRFLIRASFVDLEFEVSNEHGGGYPNKFDPKAIDEVLRAAGISWYPPLSANKKLAESGPIIRRLGGITDTVLRWLSVLLFPLLRKKAAELDSHERSWSRRLFLEDNGTEVSERDRL